MFTYQLSEPRRPFASALQATFIHASLIAGAVFATKAAPTFELHPQSGIDVFVPPVSRPVPVCDCTAVAPAPTGQVDYTVMIPTIPLDIPHEGLPPIDPRSVVGSTDLGGPTGSPSDSLSAATILSESQVDELPELVAAGALRYPAVLESAGVEGAVTLTFIIDAEGRVEPEGIQVIAATHQGFVAAAKEAVLTSRFRPARKGHQPVRVRVQQVITFKR